MGKKRRGQSKFGDSILAIADGFQPSNLPCRYRFSICVVVFFLSIDSISWKAVIILGQRGLFLPCLQKKIYLDQYKMLLGPKLLLLEQCQNDVF
jgi:hypothetical protein